MTSEAGRSHQKKAHTHRQDKEVLKAGDEYVLAAHEYFGDKRGHHGIECLFSAAICYRLANDCQEVDQKITFCKATGVEYSRCRAIEYLDDVEPSSQYWAARSGAWYELAGDILLATGSTDYATEYNNAYEVYESIGDLDLSLIENEHIRMIDMYRSVALSVGKDESYERVNQMELHYNEGTLTDWLDFKQETLPEYLDQLINQGEWIWESDGGG